MYNGKNIEKSKVYLAVINSETIENPDFLESFIYAKNLEKRIILIVDSNIKPRISTLIKGAVTDRLTLLYYDNESGLEMILSETTKMLSKWHISDFFIFN